MSKGDIMKKIVLIISVIFSLLICTVSAENIDVRVEATPTVLGDDVSVSVEYTDNTDMCGGSFNFVYDKTKLELIGVEEGEEIKNITHFINKSYADDTVRMNWVSTMPLPTEGILATVKFKLLNGNFDSKFNGNHLS